MISEDLIKVLILKAMIIPNQQQNTFSCQTNQKWLDTFHKNKMTAKGSLILDSKFWSIATWWISDVLCFRFSMRVWVFVVWSLGSEFSKSMLLRQLRLHKSLSPHQEISRIPKKTSVPKSPILFHINLLWQLKDFRKKRNFEQNSAFWL